MSNYLFIGGGKMCQAILGGLDLKHKASVVEQNTSLYGRLSSMPVVENIYSSLENLNDVKTILNNHFDCIVLAIKPQDSGAAMQKLNNILQRSEAKPEHIILSIMAGVNTDTIKSYFPYNDCVRVMPNTPILVGQGVTAVFYNTLNEDAHSIVNGLFENSSKIFKITNEHDMHAITALSGSGPAYIFNILQHLVTAAKNLGLPEDLATKLVISTMQGSSTMASLSELSLEELEKNVTSKGGTTEAALNVFKENDLERAIIGGVTAAHERSIELEKEAQ